MDVYQQAGVTARKSHIPALVHVTEATQPLGHSTSGSQERYKSAERLAWEADFDCLKRFREWISSKGIASDTEMDQWQEEVTIVTYGALVRIAMEAVQKLVEVGISSLARPVRKGQSHRYDMLPANRFLGEFAHEMPSNTSWIRCIKVVSFA